MTTTEIEFRSRSISEKVVTEFHFFHTSPAILNIRLAIVLRMSFDIIISRIPELLLLQDTDRKIERSINDALVPV